MGARPLTMFDDELEERLMVSLILKYIYTNGSHNVSI